MNYKCFIIVILILSFTTTGCGKNERAVMTGLIVKLGENSVLVVEQKENKPRAIYVSITNAKIIDEKKNFLNKDQLKLGMNVEVWVTGEIAESYPEQAMGTKLVIKTLENKSGSSISQEVAIGKALGYSKDEINNPYIRKAEFHVAIKQWHVEIGNFLDEAKIIVKKINSDTGEVIAR
ncbi:hypothetical protein GCM10023310_13880 [Paenibacillus vulneris]|uniref:DUF3221 domain-containing protein n=1 Tax=Paenibacillus vulneris TaxID=1133364 RepID=A0ABW3UH37_9BACL|nr:DUF3221 domain-containing protein [Paenibacillus sp. 32352]